MAIPIVTALPASPTNGDQVKYLGIIYEAQNGVWLGGKNPDLLTATESIEGKVEFASALELQQGKKHLAVDAEDIKRLLGLYMGVFDATKAYKQGEYVTTNTGFYRYISTTASVAGVTPEANLIAHPTTPSWTKVGNTVFTQDDAPTAFAVGDFWFDTDTGYTFIAVLDTASKAVWADIDGRATSKFHALAESGVFKFDPKKDYVKDALTASGGTIWRALRNVAASTTAPVKGADWVDITTGGTDPTVQVVDLTTAGVTLKTDVIYFNSGNGSPHASYKGLPQAIAHGDLFEWDGTTLNVVDSLSDRKIHFGTAAPDPAQGREGDIYVQHASASGTATINVPAGEIAHLAAMKGFALPNALADKLLGVSKLTVDGTVVNLGTPLAHATTAPMPYMTFMNIVYAQMVGNGAFPPNLWGSKSPMPGILVAAAGADETALSAALSAGDAKGTGYAISYTTAGGADHITFQKTLAGPWVELLKLSDSKGTLDMPNLLVDKKQIITKNTAAKTGVLQSLDGVSADWADWGFVGAHDVTAKKPANVHPIKGTYLLNTKKGPIHSSWFDSVGGTREECLLIYDRGGWSPILDNHPLQDTGTIDLWLNGTTPNPPEKTGLFSGRWTTSSLNNTLKVPTTIDVLGGNTSRVGDLLMYLGKAGVSETVFNLSLASRGGFVGTFTTLAELKSLYNLGSVGNTALIGTGTTLKLYVRDDADWKSVAGGVKGTVHYIGAKDVTVAIGAYVPKTGDYVVVNAAGTVDASWISAAGDTVAHGDMMFFDGTNWDVIAGDSHINTKENLMYVGGTLPPSAEKADLWLKTEALPTTLTNIGIGNYYGAALAVSTTSAITNFGVTPTQLGLASFPAGIVRQVFLAPLTPADFTKLQAYETQLKAIKDATVMFDKATNTVVIGRGGVIDLEKFLFSTIPFTSAAPFYAEKDDYHPIFFEALAADSPYLNHAGLPPISIQLPSGVGTGDLLVDSINSPDGSKELFSYKKTKESIDKNTNDVTKLTADVAKLNANTPLINAIDLTVAGTTPIPNSVYIASTAGTADASYTTVAGTSVTVGQLFEFTTAGGFVPIGGGGTIFTDPIAIGTDAGKTSQGTGAIAIGLNAGQTQGMNAVAIGKNAGNFGQGITSVAIGVNAGKTSQSASSIAIGLTAGFTTQSANAVAIGGQAGKTRQGSGTVAIGEGAGGTDQQTGAISIGERAGSTSQGTNSFALGNEAGHTNQGDYAVAIGNFAGRDSQPSDSMALGDWAEPVGVGGVHLRTEAHHVGSKIKGTTLADMSYNATTKRWYIGNGTKDSITNIDTQVFTDNTTAKAGGLIAGDIYRKADGTLMVVF